MRKLFDDIILNIYLYFRVIRRSFILTSKNILAFLIFTIYAIIICFGTYFLNKNNYLLSSIFLFISLFCISSILYITGQIVKNGYFSFKDLLHSYRAYFYRANFVIIFWYAVFYFINRLIITPVSSVLGDYLYILLFPIIFLIFVTFNSLPEEVYSSDISMESIFISSINFIEKHWLVWSIPNIFLLFLVNLLDYRVSILPTFGLIYYGNIFTIIQTIPFYIKILLFTFIMIFRGLLYAELIKNSQKVK